MIFVVVRDTLLNRHFIGKLRSSVQIVTGFKIFGVDRNVNHFQPLQQNFKTNAILQLPKVSETSVEVTAENAGREEVVMTTTLEERILTELSNYPSLIQVSTVQLKRCLCCLSELGFSVDDGVLMVNKCMDVLGRSESQLLETVMGLRQCKFDDEEIASILRSSPEHLLVDVAVIVSRYNSLRSHFSHKSLKHIFSNSPGVTRMKWNVIQDKLMYLHNVMRVPSHEIALSRALDCPLDVIRARHLFLERAGLFKIPNPKSNIPNSNHKLFQIIDTEDDYFAEEIAGLTAEEYFVFQEMLPLEEEEKQSE